MSDEEKVIVGGLLVLVLSICTFFYFKPWAVERMYVADKRWRYTVEECEDYTTTTCKNECTRNNDNTETCTLKCRTETHTRIHNRWSTEGDYRVEPYWPTYNIRPPYYERRRTWFGVWFKKDEQVQVYGPWDYNDYSRLKFENVYTVTTNIFGIAIKVE